MTARYLPRLVRRLLAGGLALTALFALLPVMAAQAAPDTFMLSRKVERTGHCRQGTARWDLKTKNLAGGRIYVEWEVDSIPRGTHWQLFLSQNGTRIAAVNATARTRRGVKVTRTPHNRVGRDRIRAAAVNPRTGTACFARLRF